MRYPQKLIERFGTVSAFAAAASAHPLAPEWSDGKPRILTREAVGMWRNRGVPHAWRPVVKALADSALLAHTAQRPERATTGGDSTDG